MHFIFIALKYTSSVYQLLNERIFKYPLFILNIYILSNKEVGLGINNA